MRKKNKKKRVGYKELALAFLSELKKAEKRYPTAEDPFTVWAVIPRPARGSERRRT